MLLVAERTEKLGLFGGGMYNRKPSDIVIWSITKSPIELGNWNASIMKVFNQIDILPRLAPFVGLPKIPRQVCVLEG